MDVQVEQKVSKLTFKHKIAAAVVVLLILSGYQLMRPASGQKVEGASLLYGTVQQGDMQVTVQGYGVLRSDKQKLLTSLTSATVEEIILRPGAMVSADTVIMKLNNPELLLEVERAKQNLSQQNADLRRLKLSQKREIMLENAQLAELQADYKVAKFRYENEEKLMHDGIVSELDYITSKYRHEQLSTNLSIRADRKKQLLLINAEMINIQQEQINQVASLYQTALNRVERLIIKAGIDGVLQDLPVALGQSVAAGQALALIGSTADLVALIRVPQTQAERVKLGQKTLIDTRREVSSGKVTRIVPAVVDGTVTIEVTFDDALPATARPELSVNGSIIIDNLSDVLYIERPINALENSQLDLFKLSGDGSEATSIPISFGVENGRFIQIMGNVQAGDRFILSDMRKFAQFDHVTINN